VKGDTPLCLETGNLIIYMIFVSVVGFRETAFKMAVLPANAHFSHFSLKNALFLCLFQWNHDAKRISGVLFIHIM
jgi:hypothetical protein